MNQKVIGLDIGTMNITSAIPIDGGSSEVKTLRNMFVEIDPDLTSFSEIENTDLDVLKMADGEKERLFIISEDCLRFSQIFGQSPKRPMSNGVISRGEIDAPLILKLMIENLIGKTENGYCVYSIPALPLDNPNIKTLYHEKVFSKILQSLGYSSKSLNEGMGIIFSNCSSDNFSGIGISWGCGMTNVAVSYRGIPSMQFSLGRGGDYIDQCVSDSLGIPVSRITGLKEKKLNLKDPGEYKNQREKQVLDALQFYYQELIQYVLKNFVNAFKSNMGNLEISESLPIIISGGTSLPIGFLDVVKDIFSKVADFPYSISEVRLAKDQLNAVALGNLTYALWDQKRQKG